MLFAACLLLVSFIYVSAVDNQSQPSCSLSTVKITMKNTRNKTGHWSSVVAMSQASNEVDLWLVDLEQSSSTCHSGSSTLDTIITLSAGGGGASSPSCPPLSAPIGFTRPVLQQPIPPHNYELFPGVGYYKYHPEQLNWPQGHYACKSEGGHLIILNSVQESDMAKNILARYPGAGTWFLTGILEYGVHKEYYTVFETEYTKFYLADILGEPLEKTGFAQFYPGQEDAGGPTDFGGMHRDGRYSDVNINERYPFICEFDPKIPSAVQSASNQSTLKTAPSKYELFPGAGYYKYHPEQLNWPQGHHACTSEGGHLIILNSVKESDVAKNILARYPGAGTWFLTGILEYGIHKEYYTVFGEPLEATGFTLFYPGQDDARGPRDFGGMHRDGRYSDVSIGERYPFICEFDL